jgi:hypothetical protein
MKVLVACEYSGHTRDAFIRRGHDAMSCDLLPTDAPGPHYQGNVLDILNDGWDLMIAHPECTYLTCAAEWCYKDEQPKKIKQGTLIGAARREARDKALTFVAKLWNAPIKLICIENPSGVINSRLPFMPKPQFIQPYEFGEDASKKTGLWLKGLRPLVATNIFPPRWVCCNTMVQPLIFDGMETMGKCVYCGGTKTPLPRWGNQTNSGQNNLPPTVDRWKLRSTTYLGIANAFAEQWG